MSKPQADLLLDCAFAMASPSLCAYGATYNHPTKADGQQIRTSRIMALMMQDGYVIIETMNTLYRVITEDDIPTK